jgi:hypothetical protein
MQMDVNGHFWHPFCVGLLLRAFPAASPKVSRKGFGVRRTFDRSQPRVPKPFSVRCGPIRCLAPQAHPRYIGDATRRRTESKPAPRLVGQPRERRRLSRTRRLPPANGN